MSDSGIAALGRIAHGMGHVRLYLVAAIDYLTTPRIGAAGAASVLGARTSAAVLLEALEILSANSSAPGGDLVATIVRLRLEHGAQLSAAEDLLSLPLLDTNDADSGLSVCTGMEPSKLRFRQSWINYSNAQLAELAEQVEVAAIELHGIYDLARMRVRVIPVPESHT